MNSFGLKEGQYTLWPSKQGITVPLSTLPCEDWGLSVTTPDDRLWTPKWLCDVVTGYGHVDYVPAYPVQEDRQDT